MSIKACWTEKVESAGYFHTKIVGLVLSSDHMRRRIRTLESAYNFNDHRFTNKYVQQVK